MPVIRPSDNIFYQREEKQNPSEVVKRACTAGLQPAGEKKNIKPSSCFPDVFFLSA